MDRREEDQANRPFSHSRFGALKSAVQRRRAAGLDLSPAPSAPALDDDLLERRIRSELARLVQRPGRPAQAGPVTGKVDLDLLRKRVQEAIRYLRPPAEPNQSAIEPPDFLDLDLVKSQMQAVLLEVLGRQGPAHLHPASFPPFLPALLKERVRGALDRLRNRARRTRSVEPEPRPAVGQEVLEARLKQELTRRVPRLRRSGWAQPSKPAQRLPLGEDLLRERLRGAIRSARRGYSAFPYTGLSDEHINGLIERLLTPS